MNVRTLLAYLIGKRQAILDLASSRWTLVVGFLFVLSAGFAREYDGADLLREPWHLVLPLGASLVSSFLLFCFAWCGKFREQPRPPFLSAYLSFLGLFWMTAPLAWFYAVPYERFLPAVEAVGANLWTLGVVSLWRVALMSRVFVVLFGYRTWAAISLVLLFGDVVALVAMEFLPVSPIQVMSGIHFSAGENVLMWTASDFQAMGWCTAPLWLGLAITALATSRLTWRVTSSTGATACRSDVALWVLSLTSVGIWSLMLPFTQPEQRLRSRVEKLFQEGRVAEAIAEMSAHRQQDFPPHWNPPPHYYSLRRMTDSRTRRFLDICNEIADRPTSDWVRDVYRMKLKELLLYPSYYNEEEVLLVQGVLQRWPELDDWLSEIEKTGGQGFERVRADNVKELRSRLRKLDKQPNKPDSKARP